MAGLAEAGAAPDAAAAPEAGAAPGAEAGGPCGGEAPEAITAQVRDELRSRAEPALASFNAKIIPTLPPERILGVRMPVLRKMAKRLLAAPEGQAEAYLAAQPHFYLEENELHGLLLNDERDYPAALRKLEDFLPQVDNWAVCDLLKPAAFADRPDGLEEQAFAWMADGHAYTRRFGVSVLMNFFLDDGFDARQLDAAAALPQGDYYADMMVAWYFAEALARRWDDAIPYLEGRRLPPDTHAKAIQKARESRRISPEQKDYLRSLR